MENPAPSPRAALTAMKTVYFMQVILLTGFTVFVFVQLYTGNFQGPRDSSYLVFQYAQIGLVVAGGAAGYFIYNKRAASIDPALSLREKIMALQTSTLLRVACLEVPGLFGVVVGFILHEMYFLLFSFIMIALMLLWRPTVDTVAETLNLSDADRVLLT